MAAQLFDPFEVVREEVQESVGRAEALAASFADPDDPWRQQGPSHGLPPTAGTEPRSKLEAAYMIKKGAGNMFRKLLDEATALQQAPRRNPYAKMLRREKGYYEHLARRLSRYLSALAD